MDWFLYGNGLRLERVNRVLINFNKTDSENHNEMHDRNTKNYIENICHQCLCLQIIYIPEYIVVMHCIKN